MADSIRAGSADVTIVVVPRERFSVALRSLETLYRHTDHAFQLVYVDGNSPRRVQDRLRDESRRRGFTLVRSEHYLSPNRARNIGLRLVQTPYVVFLDNDVLVTPGWLHAMVECAEQTGAWVVGPLIYAGALADEDVHNAGGFLRFAGSDGRRMLEQENRYGHRPRSALPKGIDRFRVDYVEFHCVLVRSSAFDVLGPFDEQLLSTREHLDLCLRVAAAGGEVWSETGACVTYENPPPVTLGDLPFFLIRWSEAWNTASLRHFACKYGLSPEYLQRAGGSRARRHVLFEPVREFTRRRLGGTAERMVGRALVAVERLANVVVVGKLARACTNSWRS
jgi:GT2 family glycosyltransferase